MYGQFLDPQNVSNSVWALATMHMDGDEYLPMAMLARLEELVRVKMDEFIPQGVSNCIWGFASLNKNKGLELRPDTVSRFGDGIVRLASGFKSMELSNIVWAIASMNLSGLSGGLPREVMVALDDAMCRSIASDPDTFSSQSVANTLWAAGNAPDVVTLSPRLMDALASVSCDKFHTFTPQGMTNTIWGFACNGHHPGDELMDKMREAWKRSGHTYIVTELANILWAFHVLKTYPGPECLAVVGERMLTLTDEDLHVQTLANMMYSFAQFEHLPGRATMDRVEDLCARAFRSADVGEPGSVTPASNSLSNLIWAFGVLKYKPSEEFFAAFDAVVSSTLGDFNDQGVSNVLFTYANLNHNPGAQLLDALARRCADFISVYAPQGVANTVWAWVVLDGAKYPPPALLRLYAERISKTRDEDFSKIDRVQLFQSHLALKQFSNHDGELLSGEMLRSCERAWMEVSAGNLTISAIHRDVSETLTRMGIPHEIEFLTSDGLFSVDIALRGRKVAIEVDGPSHFFANKRRERMGADLLRAALMQSKGWTVRSHFSFFSSLFSLFSLFSRPDRTGPEPLVSSSR